MSPKCARAMKSCGFDPPILGCAGRQRNTPDYHVEKHGRGLPNFGSLVDRAGRGLVGELGDGVRDQAPGGRAVLVAGGRELIGSSDAFVERLIAVALEHELRRPPDVDLGYHAAKAARLPSIKV